MNTAFHLPSLAGIHPRRYGLVAWSPHVPFAFDLMADLRPDVLVELGTHSGESYFAFCQAALENRTGTTCYAVDTWKGDAQTGFYPEEVFAEVERHNATHYPGFSYLVRKTFDEAADQFSDGSVDLIHFDGLHTYEAARHDFERWRPKLSARGVMLFHDIAARHDDFGVWRLWEEVRGEGRSFAFHHGWGLGLLLPGGKLPGGALLLEQLFRAGEAEADNIRHYYQLAADALRLRKLEAEGAQAAEQGDPIKTAREAEEDAACRVQIYFARGGVFREESSEVVSVMTGKWERAKVALPEGWHGEPWRLDPGEGFAVVDVAGACVRENATGRIIWQRLGAELLAVAEVAGNAASIPAGRLLRILCTGNDPQIVLPPPELTETGGGGPLTLEIGLRVRTQMRGLEATVQSWVREMQAAAAARAACAKLKHETAEQREEIRTLTACRKAEMGEREALEQALREARLDIADTEAEWAERRHEEEAKQQEAAAWQQEVAGLRKEVDEHEREAERLRNEIVTAREDAAREYHHRVKSEQELVVVQTRAREAEGRLRGMRRTISWKLTLPLRVIQRWVTGKKVGRAGKMQGGESEGSAGFVPQRLEEANIILEQSGVTDGGFRFHLDEPTAWDLPARQVTLRGWCLPPVAAPQADVQLRVRCGELVVDFACNLARPDVQQANGGLARALHSGFCVELTMPGGVSKMIVEAVDELKQSQEVARHRVRAPYSERTRRAVHGDPAQDYAAWVERYDTLTAEDRRRIRQQARALVYQPLVSVIMPVYNPPEVFLCKAIESVRRQLYANWQLCIADDHSTLPHVREVLERYRRTDRRIQVVYREERGHISAASNSALAGAEGEFIALLDHDDELPIHALYLVAEILNAQPKLRMIYSDEDKIDTESRRYEPYFKSDWNYDLFLGHNMFSHLGVYRRDLVEEVGGFQIGMEGSQDYDLALRCFERVEQGEIYHLPHVLYHWRKLPGSTAVGGDEKPYAREAARRAIQEHLTRRGGTAVVERNPWLSDFHRVRRGLPSHVPEVSIIIATRDGLDVLRTAVESLFQCTDYPDYRVVIVDNRSTERETLAYLDELPRRGPVNCRVLRYAGEFNFSAINNFAVREAGAEVVCLLNNDVEVTEKGWLTELVSHALRPEVGAVGARLLYPNGTLQHGGVIVGLGASRTAGHAHHRLPKEAFGHFGRAKLIQQFSAVTAACMVLRRRVFDEVEGFDEFHFPVSLNDVDLCLRLRERGYVIVWSPFAELVHHESRSRGLVKAGSLAEQGMLEEMEYFRKRHAHIVLNDPAYNPNLTLDHADFSLAVPPRGVKSWRQVLS